MNDPAVEVHISSVSDRVESFQCLVEFMVVVEIDCLDPYFQFASLFGIRIKCIGHGRKIIRSMPFFETQTDRDESGQLG